MLGAFLMTCDRARLAKIKQDQAKSISNRAKPLGRESIPLSDMPDTVTTTLSVVQVILRPRSSAQQDHIHSFLLVALTA